MLYDNLQFISLLCKCLKIKKNDYLFKKLKQTINFLEREFVNKETGLWDLRTTLIVREKKENIMCILMMN